MMIITYEEVWMT